MPAFLLPLALTGISALSGLFANRKKQQEQKSTTTENFNTSTTPTYDPSTEIMKKLLMDQYLGRTEDNADVFGGYAREGLNTINKGANAGEANIENILASRGLGRTSAGASSLVGNQMNRINQGSSLLNSIPMMADARQASNLNNAANFFSMIPKGTNTSGTSTKNTVGTATDQGNQTGGTFGALANTLSGLAGQGAFGGLGGAKPVVPAQNAWMNYQAPKINYGF